jgi:hypothetical protein
LKVRLVIASCLIILLTGLSTSILNFPKANATPGLQVTDPGNVWSSQGPYVKHLLLDYYQSSTAEFTDFTTGQLDLTDGLQPQSNYATYDSNPDFILSPLQSENGYYGVQFNGASSIWASWGCGYGQPGYTPGNGWGDAQGHYFLLNTTNPIAANNCGTNMRQAFAHLINRVDYAGSQFSASFPVATPLSEDGSPAFTPAGTPLGTSPAGTSPTGTATYTASSGPNPNGLALGTQCSWDPLMVSQNTACYTATGTLNEAGTTCAGTRANEILSSVDLGCWVPNGVGAYTITGSGNCTGTPGTYTQVCAPGNGFPQLGSPDFCAAAQHFIDAGIASSMNATTCQLTNFNPTFLANIDTPWTNGAGVSYPDHHLRFMIRNAPTAFNGLPLGNGLMNEINNLFALRPGAGPVVDPTYGNRGAAYSIVFAGPLDGWDMYTYGFAGAGPYGGIYWPSFFSSSQSPINGPCAGASFPVTASATPTNYVFVCNPTLDSILAQQSQTTDLRAYNSFTLAAMNYFGQMAGDIPVWSPGVRVAALTSVGGLVNAATLGYDNFWTVLNAHNNTGYTPANPAYAFGGGDPTTLRYGQQEFPVSLNIFDANPTTEPFAVDFNLLGEVYDQLYQASPIDPTQAFCWMCDSSSQSIVSGNTVFHIELRPGLQWQDGQPVDNRDVCFSLLSLRDFYQYASFGLNGVMLSCIPTPGSTSQVDITFLGTSLLFPTLLEQPIIPRHIWECDVDVSGGYSNTGSSDCTNSQAYLTATPCPGACYQDYVNASVNVPSWTKIQYGYDVLANNALIGSGPFMCVSSTGTVGGGCASSSVENETIGLNFSCPSSGPCGTVRLTAVTSYHPELSLTVTPSASPASGGWTVTYTYKVCNTGSSPLNASINDNVTGSVASGVILAAGACSQYAPSKFLTSSTGDTATATGLDTVTGALVATATATGSFVATTTSSTGSASVDQTSTTGVNTTITGSTSSTPVSVTSTDLGTTQPGNTQVLGSAATQFFDVQVSGVASGTANICITNSGVSTGTTLQYWDPTANGGAGAWVNAANVTISGSQICGDIPVSALSGTPIALIKPDKTLTIVSCNPSSVVLGEESQCTASVVDLSSLTAALATGSVSFTLTSAIGSLTSTSCNLANGACSVGFFPSATGTTTLAGSYLGDTTHATSSGSTSMTVSLRATNTAVSCASPVAINQGSGCTATVTDTSPGTASTPAGSVSFSSTGGTFSPATNCNLTSGSCSVTFTPSASGTITVNGNYGGDPTHSTSSGTFSPTATPRTTSAAVACSPASVTVNQATSCTVTITDTSPGTAITPGGSVTFSDSPTSSGTFSPASSCNLSSGRCTVTYTPSPGSEGNHAITATYAGDSTHSGSSSTFNVPVTKRSSSAVASCSPNFVLPGKSTACQVTVTDTSTGTPVTPTGTVNWSSSGTGSFSPTYCTLPATTATCTVTFTPSSTATTGNQQITATYQSDTDHTGSSSSSTLAVGVTPKSAVTSGLLCSFDTDPNIYGQQFPLIYLQDPSTPSTYDMVASLPLQFDYNIFYHGTPGTTVSLQVQVPYPFVTQGSNPAQLWGNVGFTSKGCFSPSQQLKGFTISPNGIALSNYSPQAMGSYVTITITGKVPSTGLVYATIQLGYGFKSTTGYTDNNNAAVNTNSPSKNVPQLQSYTFSFKTVTGDTSQLDTQSVQSENVFVTCIPGFCGIVLNSQGLPVQGVAVQIYSSTNKLLGTVYTNQYGLYYYSYTLTGKSSAKFTIQLPAYNLKQTVTLSPGSFAVAIFVVP